MKKAPAIPTPVIEVKKRQSFFNDDEGPTNFKVVSGLNKNSVKARKKKAIFDDSDEDDFQPDITNDKL